MQFLNPIVIVAIIFIFVGGLIIHCRLRAAAPVPGDPDPAVCNFHEVVPGKLYRSAQLTPAELIFFAAKYGIKSIINLRSRIENIFAFEGEQRAAKNCGIKFFNVHLHAGRTTTADELKKLYAVFDQLELPVLIHCSFGINRTGEACALWLLDKNAAAPEVALQQLIPLYGYDEKKNPEKRALIASWTGRGKIA